MSKQILDGNGNLMPLKEWQQFRGLKGDKISDNFTASEFDNEGELILSESLIDFLQMVRSRWGKPLKINSGYRTQEKQDALKKQGYKTATTSPHIEGMAADIDTSDKTETVKLVNVIKQVSAALNFPVRIGYKQYMNAGQSFVHVDVCPKYFSDGMPFHKKAHPSAWEIGGLTW